MGAAANRGLELLVECEQVVDEELLVWLFELGEEGLLEPLPAAVAGGDHLFEGERANGRLMFLTLSLIIKRIFLRKAFRSSLLALAKR